MSGRESRSLREQLEVLQDNLPPQGSYQRTPKRYSNTTRKHTKSRADAERLFDVPLSVPSIEIPGITFPNSQVDPAVSTNPNTPKDPEMSERNSSQNNRDQPFGPRPSDSASGRIIFKSGAGEIELPLRPDEREILVQQVIKQNDVNIKKEIGNFISVIATSAFTALSALAVGVTVARAVRGKKKIDLLGI